MKLKKQIDPRKHTSVPLTDQVAHSINFLGSKVLQTVDDGLANMVIAFRSTAHLANGPKPACDGDGRLNGHLTVYRGA